MRQHVGFETVFGSDVRRDGVFLELRRVESGGIVPLIEVFRSDESGDVSVWAEMNDVPLAVVSKFIRDAQTELETRADSAVPARFSVERVFVLSGRSLFVLAGRVIRGEVRPGQAVRLPGESTTSVARVDGVESVLLSAETGQSLVGLTFRYSSNEELATLKDRAWVGEELELK